MTRKGWLILIKIVCLKVFSFFCLGRVARESSPFFCALSRYFISGYINVHFAYLSAAVGKFR